MPAEYESDRDRAASAAVAGLRSVRITARGRVQGVGFRPTLYRAMTSRGCAGSVRNTPQGAVLEVEARPEVIREIVENFRALVPEAAEVTDLEVEELEPAGREGFRIEKSSAEGASLLPIPADLATCTRCGEELDDASSRRWGYEFNTCTACGPRFSIARSVPFDRANSAMDEFPTCPDCAREYRDPSDRRFHAQTISCPRCGPELKLTHPDGRHAEEPLRAAARVLSDGGILAVKGVGGFHLACDADDDGAVAELRRRKNRPHKPFAVMARSIDDCRRICEVDGFERELLDSVQSPIVLLRRRPDAPASAAVAPGLNYLGVMLPYTPLHRLLFQQDGVPPVLVMTSCNRAEEPISLEEEAVWRDLGDVVDAVLAHNRRIVNRCDDSVVATFDGRPLPVRRSRGYVPEPILLEQDGPPVFATGAMLKNTFALTSGNRAFLSQHIGNVSDADNAAHFARAFESFSRLLKLRPQAVACDMHPDYPSTAFAEQLCGEHDLPLLRVQHHHAHVASCLAENGREGPVIGVALDGTGYGEDGAVWGGEFMVADLHDYSRRYHLRYVPLPGGEQAVVHTDRMATAHLARALGRDEALERMAPRTGEEQCRLTLQVMDRARFSPQTSSCGRLFDAVSALLGVRSRVTYRGQAACELEMICDPDEDGRYEFGYDGEEINVSDVFRGICRDLDAGMPEGRVAARFHNTVADLIAGTCCRLRRETGIDTVALSGGVMQNRRLLGRTVPSLRRRGFRVLLQTAVPPNDGGICLGQAACALARLDHSGE